MFSQSQSTFLGLQGANSSYVWASADAIILLLLLCTVLFRGGDHCAEYKMQMRRISCHGGNENTEHGEDSRRHATEALLLQLINIMMKI